MILRLLRRLFRRGAVSREWLKSRALIETKVGVDLPRWKPPRERSSEESS